MKGEIKNSFHSSFSMKSKNEAWENNSSVALNLFIFVNRNDEEMDFLY